MHTHIISRSSWSCCDDEEEEKTFNFSFKIMISIFIFVFAVLACCRCCFYRWSMQEIFCGRRCFCFLSFPYTKVISHIHIRERRLEWWWCWRRNEVKWVNKNVYADIMIYVAGTYTWIFSSLLTHSFGGLRSFTLWHHLSSIFLLMRR